MALRKPIFGVLLAVGALLAVVPAAGATFPGANGKIVFSGHADNGPPYGSEGRDLFVVDPDGSNRVNLTHSADFETGPDWSADGTKLVYESTGGLWTMTADGTAKRYLLLGARATWAPSGTRIAYDRPEVFYPGTGKFEVYAVNTDGTGNTSLTKDFGGEVPSWSPRGDLIAFAHAPTGIHTMNTDGSNIRPVSQPNAFSPAFSPDGSQILYACCGYPTQYDLWLVNADGTGEHRLTNTPEIEESAVFSPDGKHILFQRPGGPVRDEVWIMNADGSGARVLIEDAETPSWQAIPNEPPDCSAASADPSIFTKHDGRMRVVRVSGVVDPDGDGLDLKVTGVTQDEPVTGRGDKTRPDARLIAGVLKVRAERSPRGDGRVYRISFTARDPHGAACSGLVTVAVPRNKHRPAIDSAPPSYDSLPR